MMTRWTVTLDQADPETDPDLEAELSKTLREEIDWEVMIDLLTEMGWSRIEINWPERMRENDAHQIKEWCRANLHGHYKGRGQTWLFEKQTDATMFALRWS